jgi:hypothetical protein
MKKKRDKRNEQTMKTKMDIKKERKGHGRMEANKT